MDKSKKQQKERVVRYIDFKSLVGLEKRDASPGVPDDGIRELKGHAAVFNQPADIGGWFSETIAPGAFDTTDFTDVPLFVNHDVSKIPLARSRRNNGSSTMTLSVDNEGLAIDARIDTHNPDAAALFSAVQRGDITGMSFCFTVEKDEWDFTNEEYPSRVIKYIKKVYEVSVVNEPAYEDTDISARDRSALENARKAVETARRASADAEKAEIELLKIKNRIIGGI